MIKKLLHKFIPANFKDVIGLSFRLLLKGKPAGRMAMLYSLVGLLLTPIDFLLQPFEKRLYRKAAPPVMPQIFVCGAPRTGTTLVAQVLIRHLPVHYFNNLTSLFPRAPILAGKLFGWLVRRSNSELTFNSFYGRTTRLAHPNDALYFWDRWLGPDRTVIPEALSGEAKKGMASFFGAVEAHSGKPLVNKNNSLNTFAHLVAEVLPNAYFICMDRDPVFLAQSHYIARKFIQGSEYIPYGIRGKTDGQQANGNPDPINDICQQVLFHRNQIREVQRRTGKDRFIILPYEDFCSRPAYWVQRVAEKVLHQEMDFGEIEKELPAFQAANKPKVDLAVLERIRQTFEQLTDNNKSSHA